MSDRLRLIMPAVFPTGYTVPMELKVESAMTEHDYVRRIRVFAPQNPLVEVVSFTFAPGRSVAHVSTRIRLAKPQDVVAVAEMNDGTLYAVSRHVRVTVGGCGDDVPQG